MPSAKSLDGADALRRQEEEAREAVVDRIAQSLREGMWTGDVKRSRRHKPQVMARLNGHGRLLIPHEMLASLAAQAAPLPPTAPMNIDEPEVQ